MAAAERGAPFGLLGRRLGHSWSPTIHAALGSAPYALFEREPGEVECFVRRGSWRGLNVTIPYKADAFRLADEASPGARHLGAANTLVRRADGSVFADNTDLAGFAWMLERFCRRRLGGCAREALAGRKALVLGSGGASQAAQAVLAQADARVSVISRRGPDGYDTLARRHSDASLIVNTTPVGMYPHCPASPVSEADLARLESLRGVLDVVYNPTRTGICLAAERLSIPFESGLAMLVAQARFSSELFQGRPLDDGMIGGLEREILSSVTNVVYIGMPGSGKTTSGKALARLLGRPFVDMDDAIGLELGVSAEEFIRTRGEAAFRAVETRMATRYGARSGLVIACGGGVVTRPENYDLLHQNGRIVLLDRPLSELSLRGRPLSQAKGVERIAHERQDLYHAWADVKLACTGSAAGDAARTRELLGI